MKLHTLPSLIATAALITSAEAATLIVSNGDFSSLVDANTATNWTDLEPTTNSVYYNPLEASAPDNIAYIFSSGNATAGQFNGFVQNLSTFNAGLTASTYGDYTINFDAGFRDDLTQTGTVNFRVALVDLGADGVYQQSTDLVLASSDFSRTKDSTPVNLTAESVNLTFSSASTNQVGLVFFNTNTVNTFQQTGMIDNISVTAIPEPSSFALLGAAGTLLLLRRRR